MVRCCRRLAILGSACAIRTIAKSSRHRFSSPQYCTDGGTLQQLNSVNRQINRDIVAKATPGNGTFEEWLISPQVGDCKDYAITKRHELLARGWPSRALLLTEVIVPDGEHHLVLVVRTKDEDLVLDNLNANIRPVTMTYPDYQWLRIKSPQNPKYWASVRLPMAAMHPANIRISLRN